ncbi:MAG: DUF692 domain-containing protein [Gammaproteobacteria bacterium]|nr:DUF692 domain-containing protein [Gammaproteobacteria bacterium]
MQFTGVSYKNKYENDIFMYKPPLALLEVHSENYFNQPRAVKKLVALRGDYPLSLHGVNLSLGGTDSLNLVYLENLKQLIQQVDPLFVSDHLAWTSLKSHYFHDLFPLPRTTETVNHIVERIQRVQTYLQRFILIENISSYVGFKIDYLAEWQMLNEIADRSGCGILLDLNNIYVSASHHHFKPQEYLQAIKTQHVKEIHLGGFTRREIEGQSILIDTHADKVAQEVWVLYQEAIDQFGSLPTIIEWDDQLPSWEILYAEAKHAERFNITAISGVI